MASMASPSPPKPWERANGSSNVSSIPSMPATVGNPTSSTLNTDPTSGSSTATSSAPALPQRPSTLNSVVNRTASNYSPYNSASRLGTQPFGGYNSYSSPYSRMGGYGGGSMYGGMGGIGGMGGYGGCGMGGMGGFGGMGYGMGGMQGDPNDPNSLTNSFNQSTQATFQIIESIVGAFGGFSQMLESTYMATHSSFFAMVSVAEQFGNLRTTLGSILGIYTLLRWIRTIFAKLTGRPIPASATDLTPSAFASFEGRSAPPNPNAPPRPSKKPFLVFMLAVFGLPYLMGKLIRALAAGQEEQQKRLAESQPDGQPLDPSKLEFCIALYDFSPEPLGGGGAQGIDLQVKKGDLVAVLSKQDPMGNPSEWWRCRSRDGRVGYLPGNFLEAVKRKNDVKAITGGGPGSAEGSRISTMSSVGKPLEPEPVPLGKGRPGELTVEAFQKSQFYS